MLRSLRLMASLILVTLLGFGSIFSSIFLSGWFDWRKNALSDLGYSTKSHVAAIFNLGLLIFGLLLILISIKLFQQRRRVSLILSALSGFLIQLIGAFDKAYGQLHTIISISLFIVIGLSILIGSIESGSKGFASLSALYIATWVLYFWIRECSIMRIGISVPETISITIFSSWFILSSLKKSSNHINSTL